MGQKTHPYGFRLGYLRGWKSRWFAKRKNYVDWLEEDIKLRRLIKKRLFQAGVSSIDIERSGGKYRVKIYTARPGLVIGRRGSEIDGLRDAISDITHQEVALDIKEIKAPQLDAQLTAESIASQLEKRISFRRAMKKAMALAMSKGAQGIKVKCAGRLGGAEIARTEGYHEGKIPLGTLRSDVDYGFAEAFTTYGTIGVKVWIYRGDILVKKLAKEKREAKEQEMDEMKPEKNHSGRSEDKKGDN
jgi:small subunit ribosomal protein S3